MIMYGDRKKLVSAVLGDDGKQVESKAKEGGEHEVGHAIAREMLDAHQNNDAEALYEAHRAMHAHLSSLEDPTPEFEG